MKRIPILLGAQAARAKIARQRTLTEKIISPANLARLEKTFGARLTPEEAVKKILDDVRERGDAAAGEWNEKIDGGARENFLVSAAEIETAYQETPRAVRDALHLA
ncbi:MAG: hypothetical protein DCC52_05515, partial [Chloroflexi bacterium]